MKVAKKIYIAVLLILVMMITFTACQNKRENGTHPKDATTFLMGTVVQMRVYGSNAQEVIDNSFTRLREIENEMSTTIVSSEISRINTHPGEDIKVNADTYRVLKKAVEYANLTNGKFNPAIGPLVKLWSIGTENARVPAEDEIKEALKLVNYQWIDLDDEQMTVMLEKQGMSLDLGAIAKGYAADEVRRIVKNSRVESAYVNLGGNVLVIGEKPDGTPWKVGIQDPRHNRGNVMASIDVRDKTLVTSGNYERYFEKDGVIYHHILDPDTGYPADSGLLSCTIITTDSFDADALSTSIFILGPAKGLELLEEIDGVEAMLITKDLGIILSSGIEGQVDILNDDFQLNGM
ncbi:FAD:protein FMN transferase [Iocasia frigidifontis]|uniref:FAD:protein FMN transferase n=1 Tax=Iocasia fonsfrigidae TaxID=2682810 RepID=A0A8A7KAS4_9FIRM|nr:FAD:protein FMN transferase [Iocasia fonsfrigidae]QTL97185.1 FAD:protein FMN transferase [Iocasia fonsfrigidae]